MTKKGQELNDVNDYVIGNFDGKIEESYNRLKDVTNKKLC